MEQRSEAFCQTVIAQLGKNSSFFEDEMGVLRRRLPFDSELTPLVVPTTLRPRALSLMHFTPMGGHPGQTRMYATMRRVFYWPHMAADVLATVRDCASCARERLKQRKRKEPLQTFIAPGPLEDVAIDLLGPFSTTKQGYKSILVITDRFSKLCQVVPLRSTEAFACAVAFVEHWVYKFGSPARLISDNGPQFVSRFFKAVCRLIGVKTVPTTAYHPETNGQTERYNRSLLAMLRHYVGEHQDDWDRYAMALTHAYNMTVHRSTGTTPFELVLSRPPPPFAVQQSPSAQKVKKSSKLEEVYLRRLEAAIAKARTRLTDAQARYKSDFDKRIKHKFPQVGVGDWVWLDPVERTGPTNKLTPAADDRYRVLSAARGTVLIKRDGVLERVNRGRVELAPPPDDPEADRDEFDPTAEDFDEKTVGDDWVVQRVRDHERDDEGQLWFHIEWHGDHPDSYQPHKDLDEEMVSRYFAALRKRRSRGAARGRAGPNEGESLSHLMRRPPRNRPQVRASPRKIRMGCLVHAAFGNSDASPESLVGR